MKNMSTKVTVPIIGLMLVFSGCTKHAKPENSNPVENRAKSVWLTIDTFESNDLADWTQRDTKNETVPYIANPQVTIIEQEPSGNHYLLKKPAAENVVGNRKALSYRALPLAVNVGETYTFYTRVNIEYFPNNHVFGLSNLKPSEIDIHDYNAFEPSLRITDKTESDGRRNDGTLMVRKGKEYAKIINHKKQKNALPLAQDTWYELWYVVNNSLRSEDGQRYDVYVRGGEFITQQLVYQDADFRMMREQPLIYFLTNCNTGPINKPYGNGGVRYDDLYMTQGIELTTPSKRI